MIAPRTARGFTLLEVMMAFVILAIAMGAIVAMLSRGLGQVSRSENASEAALYAQSMLDTLGVLEPLQTGQRQGEFGGGRYRYTLVVEPTQDPSPRVPTPVPVDPVQTANAAKLFRIEMTVSWEKGGPGQRLRFSLLRARAPLLLPASGV
jgi:general secretion pathway protein I